MIILAVLLILNWNSLIKKFTKDPTGLSKTDHDDDTEEQF
jgi:hypothetical protein